MSIPVINCLLREQNEQRDEVHVELYNCHVGRARQSGAADLVSASGESYTSHSALIATEENHSRPILTT